MQVGDNEFLIQLTKQSLYSVRKYKALFSVPEVEQKVATMEKGEYPGKYLNFFLDSIEELLVHILCDCF